MAKGKSNGLVFKTKDIDVSRQALEEIMRIQDGHRKHNEEIAQNLIGVLMDVEQGGGYDMVCHRTIIRCVNKLLNNWHDEKQDRWLGEVSFITTDIEEK